MIRIKIVTFFSFLILLITFISVNGWSSIPLGNNATTILIQSFIIFLIYRYKKRIFPIHASDKRSYTFINLYLIWTYICILRGLYIAENPYEYKQLIMGSISLIIPILAWLFYLPNNVSKVLSFWFKYGLIFFFLFFLWTVGFTQFYLSPLLFFFCFFPLFPSHKKWIILILGISYCLFAGENRSQLIKGGLALFIGVICYKQYLSHKFIRFGHFLCYLLVFVLFGFTLKHAVDILSHKQYAEEITNDVDILSKDSRSLIYVDVITSSIENNYFTLGRTPARGNDIIYSGVLFKWAYDDDFVFNKNERHYNELVLLNVFTWEGLIGLILYSLIYMKASYLAVYKSNNMYISLLGCYIALRWVYGWIEDLNNLDILNISLWMMIGVCYSPIFRNMSNEDFQQWIKTII